MEELGKVKQYTMEISGLKLVFNVETIIMTWIVILVLILFAIASRKKMGLIPNPFQVVAELLAKVFYNLCDDALGSKLAPKYFPLIFTLFLFIWLSNMIGVVPIFSEPTKDLNTTLSLGVLGFIISHYSGIRAKGIKQYLKEYCEPIFFMAPLNVIGELAKVVSISFRLYGNIMGGGIIIIVVSHLIYQLILPPALLFFFGLFVGTVQAFVFTMLTLVYISLQVK